MCAQHTSERWWTVTFVELGVNFLKASLTSSVGHNTCSWGLVLGSSQNHGAMQFRRDLGTSLIRPPHSKQGEIQLQSYEILLRIILGNVLSISKDGDPPTSLGTSSNFLLDFQPPPPPCPLMSNWDFCSCNQSPLSLSLSLWTSKENPTLPSLFPPIR